MANGQSAERIAVSLTGPEVSLVEGLRPLDRSVILTRANLDHPGPTIIGGSRGWEALTGYSVEEVIGRSPRLVQGPLTDRQVLSRLRAVCARGERFEGEAVNYRKSGEAFLMHWCIDPVRSAAGQITHYVAVQEDVTDRRHYARQWLQAETQRSSALSRASEQLAAIAEAILVLQQTKHSFRSSQLADLRYKLAEVARRAAAEDDGVTRGDAER